MKFEEFAKGKYSRQYKVLTKNGITSGWQLLTCQPKKYYDLTSPVYDLTEEVIGKKVAVVGRYKGTKMYYKDFKPYITITLDCNGQKMTLMWNNKAFSYLHYNYLKVPLGTKICARGPVHYFATNNSYSIFCPEYVEEYTGAKLVPTWGIKDISDAKMQELIGLVEPEEATEEYLPEFCLKLKLTKYGRRMPGIRETFEIYSHPKSANDLNAARFRSRYEDMLYFALRISQEDRQRPKGSSIVAPDKTALNKYIEGYEYPLTRGTRKGECGQKEAIDEIVNDIVNGRRVDAILEGDVGCGKTTVAFAVMVHMAGNGHQSALCAPTEQVAKQHYTKLLPVAEQMGKKAVLLLGKMKASERKKALAMLESGEALFAVGTHALFSKNVVYKDLCLVLMDEEHNFGVMQKQAFYEKGVPGMHNIAMSATLIPRTSSVMFFSEQVKHLSINVMPSARKPVQTYLTQNESVAWAALQEEYDKGHQIYVVCPLVSKSDADSMEGVSDVETTAKELRKLFQDRIPKEFIGTLTGKTKQDTARKTMEKFQSGEIRVLVATTIIAVGVDVPNATLIIVRSPERFGLAVLHQLRGRVGRGSLPSKCILLAKEEAMDKERLVYLAEHDNGYEIAEKDYEERGFGNYIGKEQSGHNRYVMLALNESELFNRLMTQEAPYILEHGMYESFMDGYKKVHAIMDE